MEAPETAAIQRGKFLLQELLSRGPSVEVLTPTWFRDEVADDVAEMAKLYAR